MLQNQRRVNQLAVFGLGVVGLAAAEGARVSGASRIFAVDLNPNRIELDTIDALLFTGLSQLRMLATVEIKREKYEGNEAKMKTLKPAETRAEESNE